MMNRFSQDSRVAIRLVALVVFMLAAAFAAVPLYDLFCRVTGFSGTTQFVESESDVVLSDTMVVRFSANKMSDIPWEFSAVEPQMKVRIGETNLAFYEAYNPTDDVITGTASYNVSPLELGGYFNKIDCFCFVEQTLQPGERVQMPVSFYIDPEFVEDPDVKNMKSITLAYTFHLTSRETVGKTHTVETVAHLDN